MKTLNTTSKLITTIVLLAASALWAAPVSSRIKHPGPGDERRDQGTKAPSLDSRVTPLEGPTLGASKGAIEVTDIGPERGLVLGLDGFLIDPGNPNVILASTDTTGVFKSTDGGKSWRPANTGLIDSFGHQARLPNIRRDPSHPRTVYAASLAGLYRSTDFGEHWSQLSNTFGLKDVAISPTDPSVLFAVGFDGFVGNFYKSTDGGATLVPQTGIGLPDPDPEAGFPFFSNVVITPSDPQTIYVADESSGFYKSTDGGASFTFLPGDYGVALQVFPHPTQRDTVFFEAGGFSATGLLRSTDGGATFSDVAGGLPVGGAQFVTFDPRNPSTVYVASTAGLARSTDGGLTFTSLGLKPDQLGPARGGGALVVNLDPTNSRVLYVNSGERNFKSIDRGRSFTEIDSGFRATQVSSVAFDNAEDESLYIVADRILFRTRDRGKHYDEITLPDGAFPGAIAVAPTDRNRIVVTTVPSGILWSSDRGRSWSTSVIDTGVAFFGGRIVFDPQNAQNVYIASNRLLHSTDGGQTFATTPLANFAFALAIDPQHSNVIYTGGVNGAINGPPLVAKSSDNGLTFADTLTGLGFVDGIIVNPQDPKTVYAAGFIQRDLGEPYGADINIVLRSTDGGVTFTAADAGLSGNFSSIGIDPVEPARLFALSSTGLFRTEDGGSSWSLLDPGGETLLHNPSSLKINPKQPKLLYLAGASLLEVEISN